MIPSKENDSLYSALHSEIYYAKKYVQLYNEKQNIVDFNYKKGENEFYCLSVKNPIEKIGELELSDGYFDSETPYGYGGPITNSEDQGFIEEALLAYSEELKKQNVIAEFLRFNPFNAFPEKFGAALSFSAHERNTISINLNRPLEDIFSSFKSSLRRNIRKAIQNNLVFRVAEKTDETIMNFAELYTLTMQKNKASQFYFFDKTYFKDLCKIPNVQIVEVLHEGKVTNAAILFEESHRIYYHLGASHPDHYHLNGNPFLFYSIAGLYAEKKNELFLGGGNSISPEDALFKFKSKFNPTETLPFYIGGLIVSDIYHEYCELRQKQAEEKIPYFLKYRF